MDKILSANAMRQIIYQSLILMLTTTPFAATDDFDPDFDKSLSETGTRWFSGYYQSARGNKDGPDIKQFPRPLTSTGCNFYLTERHKLIAYRGGCKNGLANGQGEFWAKRFGKRYYLAGNFVAGKAQGEFLRIDEKPARRTITTWVDGFETGPAEIWYHDGWYFTGNLSDGLRKGRGRQVKWFEKYSERIEFDGVYEKDDPVSGEFTANKLGRQRLDLPKMDFNSALATLTGPADRVIAAKLEQNPFNMTNTANYYRQHSLEGKFLDVSAPLTYIASHQLKQGSSCNVRTSANVSAYRGECKDGFAHGFGELWEKTSAAIFTLLVVLQTALNTGLSLTQMKGSCATWQILSMALKTAGLRSGILTGFSSMAH